MERTSRDTWAERVERWKDSGLTAKEYAAGLGISAGSLSWWKWRLSSEAASPKPGRPGRRSAKSGTRVGTSPVTFVEVTTHAAAAEPLEIMLPSSVRIRVPSSFDAAALGRLLDVLEQRR
jgi:hypothetical protein